MHTNLPKFQKYVTNADTIEHSLQNDIRSYYLPISPDFQYPMQSAYKNTGLKRDDIFLSISTVNTIPSIIESRLKSLIYADMIVWEIPRYTNYKTTYDEWIIKSWKTLNELYYRKMTYNLAIMFNNYTYDETVFIIDKILKVCKDFNLRYPDMIYTANTDHILKLKDIVIKNSIKLAVKLTYKNTSDIIDKTGVSLTVLQNTFYHSHDITVLATTDNNKII